MTKIGIVGSADFIRESKIAKFIKHVYDSYGPTATINSGGSDLGPERWAKKYALEFNLKFKEFNPSYTGYKMYSAMDEAYYGKKFHMSQLYHRYKQLIIQSDCIFIFHPKTTGVPDILKYVIKECKKFNKPCVLVY